MTLTTARTRRETMERLVATAYARDRLAAALFEVVADGLEFGPCDLPSSKDRDWIRGAIAIPLQEAADQALEGLVWRLAAAFERAPDGLLDRLDRSRRWRELGWD
jgi:hypothetical protein